jgi:hypothetical protein
MKLSKEFLSRQKREMEGGRVSEKITERSEKREDSSLGKGVGRGGRDGGGGNRIALGVISDNLETAKKRSKGRYASASRTLGGQVCEKYPTESGAPSQKDQVSKPKLAARPRLTKSRVSERENWSKWSKQKTPIQYESLSSKFVTNKSQNLSRRQPNPRKASASPYLGQKTPEKSYGKVRNVDSLGNSYLNPNYGINDPGRKHDGYPRIIGKSYNYGEKPLGRFTEISSVEQSRSASYSKRRNSDDLFLDKIEKMKGQLANLSRDLRM